MAAVKRLRRIKDGVIMGYSTALSQALGMEVVMCEGPDNKVVEVIGEVGRMTVRGRVTTSERVVSDPVLPQAPPPVEAVETVEDEFDVLLGTQSDADNSDLG